MLEVIAPNIWHLQHRFLVNAMPVSSRMTVVRLNNGSLWLHSPVPLNSQVRAELEGLGNVAYIVAPSKTHHLFTAESLVAFPQAKLFGAPGLIAKRPDLKTMRELSATIEAEWQDDLDQIFFAGIPFGNETVWFHKSSRTLIVTDLCQWWQGALPLAARVYASLTGVRKELAVPRTVRFMVKDRVAAKISSQKILLWPFERVIVAHNTIIEKEAHSAVEKALACFND